MEKITTKKLITVLTALSVYISGYSLGKNIEWNKNDIVKEEFKNLNYKETYISLSKEIEELENQKEKTYLCDLILVKIYNENTLKDEYYIAYDEETVIKYKGKHEISFLKDYKTGRKIVFNRDGKLILSEVSEKYLVATQDNMSSLINYMTELEIEEFNKYGYLQAHEIDKILKRITNQYTRGM